MKTANQYPVTTPYGKVAGYPLNNGFHNGIDYGCPTGTPVVVNGVQIGLSGSTGYSTGPHLHVGRWVNGLPTNPKGGFTFKSAKVTEINQDKTNGKYVRVQADGASWVYLHLSKQTCKVGQTLKGASMSPQDKLDLALGRKARRDHWQAQISTLSNTIQKMVQVGAQGVKDAKSEPLWKSLLNKLRGIK